MAATREPRVLACCVDCGKPIRPPAERCRTHAAAEARRVMSFLRHSSELVIDGPSDAPAEAIPRMTATAAEPERGIIELWLKRAFKIAAESDPSVRAVYLRLHRNTLIPLVEIDGSHRMIGRTVPLTDYPFLVESLKTCEPRMVVPNVSQLGPVAQEILSRTGVVAAITVPVIRGSAVHGVMVIEMRRPEISEELFQALISVKGLLELALSYRSCR